MTEQNPYLVFVSNFTGCVIGVSDYGFSCVIHADSKDEARAWGIEVATEFADRFGFPPHNIKPDRSEIISNTFVLDCDDPSGADHECVVGSYPAALQ